jgi:hypothetical protein
LWQDEQVIVPSRIGMWADRMSAAFRRRWHVPQVSNSVALVNSAV